MGSVEQRATGRAVFLGSDLYDNVMRNVVRAAVRDLAGVAGNTNDVDVSNNH